MSVSLAATLHAEAPPAPGLVPPPNAGACLRLVLIGRMEAWSLASVQVLPRTRKARALLAVLGMAVGTPVSRLRLAELLWSRRAPEQQRGSLRQALHELQEALSPVGVSLLVPSRDAVMLRAGQVWVDAIEAARTGQGQPETLDLLTGDLLADLDGLDPAFDIWLAEQRRRLHDAAIAQAALLLERAEEPAAAAAAARRLLGFDPANEGAWRALIRAEAGRGDRGAALAAFESCRGLLADRFNATPSPETEALGEALRADGPAPPMLRAPPPPRPPAPRGGLRGARLGVAPLRVIGAVEQHLSIGLAEEITAALARFRWIFVVDSASLALAAAERGDELAAHAMGLDFLLAGTVQRAGDRVRVLLRLTDLRDNAGLVWSGRFDRDAGDILALQDAVAAEVVARIDPEILLIEASRASARGAVNASAYDLLLRAIVAIHRLDHAGFIAADGWLREAMALEPENASVHAWLAYWHLFLVGQGWAKDEAGSMAEAERLAQRAIALDPLDAQALTIFGHVRAFLHHRLEEGLALHERALALNPNLAMAWVFSGMALSYLGQHEAALRRLDRYAQLAPCHPHGFFFDAARGIPLLCLGRNAEAVEAGRKATALHAGLSYPYKTLLSALGHLGQVEEAAAVRARLLAIEPDFTLDRALRRTPLRQAEDLAHYEAGLRRAGLE